MSEPLPTGWKLEPLRRLAQVVSGGTPSRYVPEFWEGGNIPWVTPTDITNSNDRFLHETREHITELGLQSCSAKKLPTGTLLMTSRATLGEVRIAMGEVCTNQGFKSLIPFKGIDGHFLYYQIILNRERYEGFGIGSTFLEVNKRDTERFELLVAPEKEQHRIAEILSTVDQAIEQTAALIEKYQQIKAGLMHDLCTRGVTPDGHLRPTRAQVPHLYKESPLGWIPKEWDIMPLDGHVRIIDCKHFTPKFQDEGFPFIRPRNVKVDGLDLEGVDYVSREDFEMLTDVYRPRRGDIVFSRNASFGVPCYIDTDLQFAIGQDCVIMTAKASNTRYVFVALTNSISVSQVTKVSSGSTFGRINLGEIRKLLVPYPGIEEEQRIADRVLRCDQFSKKLKHELEKLCLEKHGLMHDLLTGRVRVKVAEVVGASPH